MEGRKDIYTITREQWEKIPKDYKGVSVKDGKTKCCFACFITPDKSGGTALLFENLHFVII